MRQPILSIVFSIVFLSALSSCGGAVNSRKKNVVKVSSPSPSVLYDPPYTDYLTPGKYYGNADAKGVNNCDKSDIACLNTISFDNYHTISAVFHGGGEGDKEILWNSGVSKNLTYDQRAAIMTTDKKFRLRVIPRSAAGLFNKKDDHYLLCKGSNSYNFGKIDIVVKTKGANDQNSWVESITFLDVPIDRPSMIKDLSIIPTTPIVIGIASIHSDYICRSYIDQGVHKKYSTSWNQSCSPPADSGKPRGMNAVHKSQCMKVDIQIVTDSTPDFP